MNKIDENVDTLLLLIKEYFADYILLKDDVDEDVVDVLSSIQQKVSKHFESFKFGDLINETTQPSKNFGNLLKEMTYKHFMLLG